MDPTAIFGLGAHGAGPIRRPSDPAAALVWRFQAPASAAGSFGPVAQPDRATVS